MEHWEPLTGGSSCVAEHPQLVDDGVPVVISVDERDIDGRKVGKHLEAGLSMKEVLAGKGALVFGRVKQRLGVDDVQFGARIEWVEHANRRVAAVCADLHDPPTRTASMTGATAISQNGNKVGDSPQAGGGTVTVAKAPNRSDQPG